MRSCASLIILEEAESTQDEARSLLEAGQKRPVWVMARKQTAGRGRGGRSWKSSEGNLAASLLLWETGEPGLLPQLSFIAALALHKAVRALAMRHGAMRVADNLELKWPNDLLLFRHKLAGILLECGSAACDRTPVIMGYGVNIRHAPDDADLRWPAVSLAEEGLHIQPEALLRELDDHFWRWHALWRQGGFAPIRKAWMKRAWGVGKRVRVGTGTGMLVGTFRGLDERGAMILEEEGGRVHALHAGEIEGLRPSCDGY